MRGWRSDIKAVVEPSLGISALLAVCLFLLPLYTAPPYTPPLYSAPHQHAPKQPSSGMDAPPPAVLESFRTLGSWGSLERRMPGGVPPSYSLEAPTARATGSGRLPQRVPEVTRDTLALQGQWRLEGG